MVICPAVAADYNQIKSFYESVIRTDDSALAEKQVALSAMEDDIKALTPDEIRLLLPIAAGCWRSERSTICGAGLVLLVPISLRPDSEALLEPYVESLIGLLTAPEPGIRKGAVYLLGATQPAASFEAMTALIAHLSDQKNSADELRMNVAAVLGSHPSDAGTIHAVLAAVEQRPEFKIKGATIQMLGLYTIINDKALGFIRSGLSGDDRHLRESAIDAVERLPKAVRSTFRRDLQHITDDPSESPEVRSRAAPVLN